MLLTPPGREKLFKRFKSGEGRALHELFAAERAEVFDYLLRMTGQVSKSTDTIDELLVSLDEQSLRGTESYTELRNMLFSTVRRFAADVWNVDTSRLINAALEPEEGEEAPSEQVLRERAYYRPVDRALRSLPAREREVIILRARGHFEFGETARIMGIGERQVELSFADALSRLDHECPGIGNKLEEALARLPIHPEPIRSSQRTINLSMVMQDIKTKPVGLWSPFRMIVMIVGLILAGFIYFEPDVVSRAIATVHGLVAGDGEKP